LSARVVFRCDTCRVEIAVAISGCVVELADAEAAAGRAGWTFSRSIVSRGAELRARCAKHAAPPAPPPKARPVLRLVPVAFAATAPIRPRILKGAAGELAIRVQGLQLVKPSKA
jgi:hypothetical protein